MGLGAARTHRLRVVPACSGSARGLLLIHDRSQAVHPDRRPVVLDAQSGALRHWEMPVVRGVELVDVIVGVDGDVVGVRSLWS